MKLKARTKTGIIDFDISPNETITSLKDKLSSLTNITSQSQKLIFDGDLLNGDKFVNSYSIKEGDTIVVLLKRQAQVVEVDETKPYPTKQLILEITSQGKGAPSTRPVRYSVSPLSQLKSQLQDLVNSLTGQPPNPISTTSSSLSQNIQQDQEEDEEVEEEGENQEENAKEQSETLSPPEVDEESLKLLKDMGFSEESSKKALILNRMNPELAMEWLLQHSSDPNLNKPLTQNELKKVVQTEKKFVPNPEAMKQLKDMGFQESEITKALKITNNNQEAACAWLLGDRNIIVEDTSGFSLEDASLIQTVLSNPTIQLGLSNPRVLLALKALIDNPAAASQFVNDPEVGPVLLQVSQILSNQ